MPYDFESLDYSLLNLLPMISGKKYLYGTMRIVCLLFIGLSLGLSKTNKK